MEIGGEFWLDNLPGEENQHIPDWINKFGNIAMTSSGRGAIFLLLNEISPLKKTALLPVYTCDSVIVPFIANGYTCSFYDINSDLSPDIKDINSDNFGIFLHNGYFGFPTNNNLATIVKKFKENQTIIVEDITHTLFSDYSKFDDNDYYIASLRKWMPLPSGGMLASPKSNIKNKPLTNEYFAEIRKTAILAKSKYVNGDNQTLKPECMKQIAIGERFLNENLNAYNIDSTSMALLNMADIDIIKQQRRANYSVLAAGLMDCNYMQPIFRLLPDGICPLFYPIYIKENRKEIQQKLIEQKIYCPIHWPVSEYIDIEKYKNAAKIYDTVLSIPCDQRYNTEDMEKIIAVMRDN